MTAAQEVLKGLDAANTWQEELYVHLHKHPELPMQEVETAAEITRRLESYGYAVQQIGGGVVGVLERTAAGAKSMVADGLVDKVPQPDVALGQHVLTAPQSGKVAPSRDCRWRGCLLYTSPSPRD